MDPTVWGIIGIAALVVLRGFFSSARIALGSVRRQGLRDLVESTGDQRARAALEVAEDSSRVLSTFRLANLLADFVLAGLLAVVALPPLAAWLTGAFRLAVWSGYLIAFIVAVPLAGMLTFLLAESLPDAMIHQDPTGWAIRLARPAQATITLFRPLVVLLLGVRRGVATVLGAEIDSGMLVTEEEIMTLVDAGEEEGSIELEEKEMIYSIFQLDETLAREIMVPRIDIVALEIGTPLEDARRVVIDAGHSRIPVYEESLDHIKGMLYAKDLLEIWHNGGPDRDLTPLLRPAMFIPETKRVSDLLRELQSSQVHLAIVIDEYGGTAGLVTIEDIMEEIVGEIFDEYDEAVEAAYQAVGEGEYIFDARIDLDDFNRLLDVNLPTELGDTLGGFIYGRLGKVPEPGEIIETNRMQITVLDVVDRRIRKARVKLIQPEEADASSEREHRTEPHARSGNH